MKKLGRILAVAALVLMPLHNIPLTSAVTDTCTWTGATNANWNNSGNWTCSIDGAAIPEAGDALIFPESASNKSTVNDIGPLSLTSVQISGSGYNLSGIGLTLTATTPLIVNQNATIDINITYAPSMNAFLRVSATQTLTVTGTTTFSGVTGEVNIGGGGFSGTIDFNDSINGDAGTQFIAVNDARAIVRAATNNFSADTVGAESDGVFECRSATCFGNNANNIYSGNGIVELRTSATYSNDWETSASSAGDSWFRAYASISITGNGTVNDAIAISQNTDGESLQFTGGITNTSTISVFGSSTAAQVRFDGAVSGAGGFSYGGATTFMSANSTYSDTNTVNSGAVVLVDMPTGLGSTAGVTNILNGGKVQFDFSAPTTVTEPFQIAGTGITTEGALQQIGDATTLSGTITLAANSAIANDTVSTIMTLSGVISGTGELTLLGDTTPGIISIEGSSANTFTGDTNINGVIVQLSKTSGHALTGNVDVTANASSDAQLQITSSGNNQLSDTAIIKLTNSSPNLAILVPYDANETIGMVTGDGVISHVQTNDKLTVGGGNLSGTFNGTFSNFDSDGIITKTGSGIWTLSGATADSPTETVTFDIQGGQIVWSSALAAFPISIGSGGVLKGTGSVGPTTINSGGAINVGNSPGCMTLASLTLNNGSTFTEEIAGSTACTSYDQTTVTGSADITNATLQISLTTTPADGQVFTILNAGSIVGTFNGLANGATITVSGVTFRVNYTSTTVTLTKLAGTNTTTTTTSTLQSTGVGIAATSFAGITLMTLAVLLFKQKKQEA